MGDKFSKPLGDEGDEIVMPVSLRSRSDASVDVEALTAAEVRQELLKRGVNADSLLRAKLKELLDAENQPARVETPLDTPVVESEGAAGEVSLELAGPTVRRATRRSLSKALPKVGGVRTAPRLRRKTTTAVTPIKPVLTRRSARRRPQEKKKIQKRSTPKRKTPVRSVRREQQEEDYDVAMILDVRRDETTRQFLIRWDGYGSEDNEWIPESSLTQPVAEYKQSDAVKSKLAAGITSP